jgi:hypothetical protein
MPWRLVTPFKPIPLAIIIIPGDPVAGINKNKINVKKKYLGEAFFALPLAVLILPGDPVAGISLLTERV